MGQNTPRAVNSQQGHLHFDEANNRIVIVNTDATSLIFGLLPDGDFGVAFLDSSGYIVRKSNIVTDSWYDKTTQTKRMEQGLLPDATYNLVTAKPGENLATSF